MTKPYKYRLGAAAALTALVFWLDKDDAGPQPQPVGQMIFEIVVWGGLYTLLFFLLFSGINFIAEKAFKNIK